MTTFHRLVLLHPHPYLSSTFSEEPTVLTDHPPVLADHRELHHLAVPEEGEDPEEDLVRQTVDTRHFFSSSAHSVLPRLSAMKYNFLTPGPPR